MVSGGTGTGGAVNCAEEWSYVVIKNSILWQNTGAYGPEIGVGKRTTSVFDPSADVDVSYSDVQGGQAAVFLEQAGKTAAWWLTGNINADPNFAVTSQKQRTYYLSQTAAGQHVNSVCVDAGGNPASDLAGVAGHGVTTRTDHVADVNTVDMGYHYNADIPAPTFTLVFSEVDDGFGPYGILSHDPNYATYYQGTVVNLHAVPRDATTYHLKQWNGADRNTTLTDNTITMTGAMIVTVEFESILPSLITRVVDDSNATANNGTLTQNGKTGKQIYAWGTVVNLVATPNAGYSDLEWTGTDDDGTFAFTNKVTMNAHKTVTVMFYVPKTINVPGDYVHIQDAINAANRGDIVLIAQGVHDVFENVDTNADLDVEKDITITGMNPDDPCTVARTIIHGGMFVNSVSRRCIVKGFTIEDTYYVGVSGCNGCDTTCGNPATDGMNGASIGGIIELWDASPQFINIVVQNCSIGGGNGGNGCSPGGDGGWGGWAHGGAVSDNNGSPLFKNCIFRNNLAYGGDGGNAASDGGHGGSWGDPNSARWMFGPYLTYEHYSGYGGGAYCGSGSKAEFNGCQFINNRALGGSCGVSPGAYSPWPHSHYRIQSYGGGAYCDQDSSPRFVDCIFTGNTADVNGESKHADGTATVPDQPYLSYGGAIGMDVNSHPTFENCTINGNKAWVGGGIYSNWGCPTIIDSNFSSNVATNGGGAYLVGGVQHVQRTLFLGNTATFDEPNEYGQGGGLYSLDDGNSIIVDCNFRSNMAGSSGGGLYIDGIRDISIKNCLIVLNSAGRDGGGISANWYADPNIADCTIASNYATGTGYGTSYGGGLYTSYKSSTQITDTIIWGNTASHGNQIGVGTGFFSDKQPSNVNVTYSDVLGGAANVYFDSGCTLNWNYQTNMVGNSSTDDPQFVGGYHLSQTAAGQKTQSPCVDKGSVNDVNLVHLRFYSTRTDHVEDVGRLDLGYHYWIDTGIDGDFDMNGRVDLIDMQVIGQHWLQLCTFPYWCDGADLNHDGVVNMLDEGIFSSNYGQNEKIPPEPDPMTWVTLPYPLNSSTMHMVATTAVDNTGLPVTYEFAKTDSQGNEILPYLTSTTPDINVTGLSNGQIYGFKVRAVDFYGNRTGWSTIAFADSVDKPQPDPMKWATQPVLLMNPLRISMTAATATCGTSGVDYGFEEVDHHAGTIIWQSSPTYTDTALDGNTTYAFHCFARNHLKTSVVTAPSPTVSVTIGNLDLTPPSPPPTIVSGTQDVFGGYYDTITISTGTTDASGVVQYQLGVTPGTYGALQVYAIWGTKDETGKMDVSPWLADPAGFADFFVANFDYQRHHNYQVRARDAFGNMTVWSPVFWVP
jgi:hypothetical protein